MNAMSEEMVALEKIPIISTYIQQNGEIIKVIQEEIYLNKDDEGGSFLSKYNLTSWISKRRMLHTETIINDEKNIETSTKYRLDDILMFHFIDEQSIEDGTFMHTYSTLEDIDFEESLPLYHNLSSIYLFFRESVTDKKPPLKIIEPMKLLPQQNDWLTDIESTKPNTRSTRKKHGRIGRGTRKINIL
jgi:hypothetical protein